MFWLLHSYCQRKVLCLCLTSHIVITICLQSALFSHSCLLSTMGFVVGRSVWAHCGFQGLCLVDIFQVPRGSHMYKTKTRDGGSTLWAAANGLTRFEACNPVLEWRKYGKCRVNVAPFVPNNRYIHALMFIDDVDQPQQQPKIQNRQTTMGSHAVHSPHDVWEMAAAILGRGNELWFVKYVDQCGSFFGHIVVVEEARTQFRLASFRDALEQIIHYRVPYMGVGIALFFVPYIVELFLEQMDQIVACGWWRIENINC